MALINTLLSWILSILETLLPVFGFSPEFMGQVDGAFDFLIGLYQGASYFLPLSVLVSCLSVMLLIDNWSLMYRFGKWVIGLVRG